MKIMYDATDVNRLPNFGADLLAGYDDGRWPDANAIQTRFPGQLVLRITVFPRDNEGDVLDCETGDANPADCPQWVARRRQAGHPWPTIYCAESTWAAVKEQFVHQGVPQPYYWIAGYPGSVGARQLYPGSIAHQWIDHGSYDESVVADAWPPVGPTVIEEDSDMGWTAYDPDSGGFWATDQNGDLNNQNGAPFVAGLNQHPEYRAGAQESGGAQPCIGIETFKDKNDQHGIVYIIREAGTTDQSGLRFFRFARDGSPD